MKYIIYFILVFAIVSAVVCLCGVDLYHRGLPYPWLTAGSMLLLAVAIWKFPLRFFNNKKIVFITGFGVANVIMWTVLLTFVTLPISDYECIRTMGLQFAEGDYVTGTTAPYAYGYLYNWQVGISFIESLIFRIFHPYYKLMELINLLIINITLYLLYLTAKSLLNEKCGLMAFAMMCVFYPMLVSVAQFSNLNLSVPLILIFILLCHRRKFFWAGLLVSLISFIRPIGIVLVTAFICMAVYNLVRRHIDAKTLTLRLLAFLLPCILCTLLINVALIHAGVNSAPISRPTLPYFKFYQGLHISDWHNPAEKIEEFGGDVDKYNDWTKREVTEAYTDNLGSTLLNNVSKTAMFLGSYDWKFAYTYNQIFPEFNNRAITGCVAFGWAEYIILLCLCVVGFGRYYRQRGGADIMQIIFAFFVAAYFFIEAWPDYRYELYPFMFIIASAIMCDRFPHKINLTEENSQNIKTPIPQTS